MVVTKLITLTSVQVLALHATPIIALAAPPAGYVNNIFGINVRLVYNSAAYAGGGNLTVGKYLNNSNANYYLDNIILAATSNYHSLMFTNQSTPGLQSWIDDLYVTTDNVQTLGNSPIQLYITYEQIPLS